MLRHVAAAAAAALLLPVLPGPAAVASPAVAVPTAGVPIAATVGAALDGGLIVAFEPGVTQAAVEDVYRDHAVLELEDLDADAGDRDEEEKVVAGRDGNSRELIQQLERDPRVDFVEPNHRLRAHVTPNDPGFSRLWGLHNTGQSGGTVDADLDAPEAWDGATSASSVVVGVIDSGVSHAHEDLAANMWVNPGETAGNGIDDDGNGYIDDVHGIDARVHTTDPRSGDPMDRNGHGTHVAGTIAASGDNGIGVVGTAWTAQIAACAFLDADGAGYTSDAIECFKYFNDLKRRGVPVVVTNNSWGGGGYSRALEDAMAGREQPGTAPVLHVVAAGNDGLDIDTTPDHPASSTLPNVVTVAATDRSDAYASFSNWGATSVDLAAPGVGIVSTTWTSATPTTGYATANGTSMAAPHVAGAAALLAAGRPELDAAALRGRLLDTGDPLPSPASSPVKGTATDRRLNLAAAVDGTAPSAPTALGAVDVAVGGVLDLSWAPGSDAYLSRHHVHQSSDAPGAAERSWTRVATLPGGASSYRLTGLVDGRTAYYAVSAVDRSGNESARSAEAAGASSDATAPATPTGLLATAGERQVALDWTDNVEQDLAGYAVERSTDGVSWSGVATPAASAYTDTSLAEGTTYSYRARARDTAGNASAATEPVSAAPVIDIALPDPTTQVPPPAPAGGGGGGGGSVAAPAPPPAPAPAPAPTPVTTPTVTPTKGSSASSSTRPPSADQPLVVSVTSPVAGDIRFALAEAPVPPGVHLLGAPLNITAPVATAQTPLQLVVRVDASALPPPGRPVMVLRDGRLVADCEARGVAVPDPCLARVSVLGDGDLELVVLSAHASTWQVATPQRSSIALACPAPPYGGFLDLVGNPHADAAGCLAAYGVASGRSASSFGPSGPVTRAQMASFLARLLDAAGVALPADPPHPYADVPADAVHARPIAQLAALGVVRGTGPGRFDPGASVTRAQMATFLRTSYELASGTQVAAPSAGFADVPAGVHSESIDAVAALGVTTGATPTSYQPAASVRRDQMASFLARAANLLVASRRLPAVSSSRSD